MLLLSILVIYWISLSTWFGSVLAIALSAPVIFKTVEDAKPILSNVLSVNLDGQHSTLLAGSIVVNLVQKLHVLELICGSALLLMLIGQAIALNMTSTNLATIGVRGVLLAGAAGIMLFDWRAVWPRLEKNRSEYIDHADEPDVANPAKDRFDNDQRLTVNLLVLRLALLLGLILFSSNVGNGPTVLPASGNNPNSSAIPMGNQP